MNGEESTLPLTVSVASAGCGGHTCLGGVEAVTSFAHSHGWNGGGAERARL